MAWLAVIVALLVAFPAFAQDEGTPTKTDAETCLACHRFPGLARLDPETDELRLFFVSQEYYSHREGPHSRLECTACHPADQVDTIPHDEVTPVDCTTTCHLTSAFNTPITFSHAAIAERIGASVHKPDAMAELPFATAPLRPGQSNCLYCHDQPVFRDIAEFEQQHRGTAATARCETCHGESFPVDVQYFLSHTTSRLESARPIQQTAQVCATCHSDPSLLEHMDQQDAVTSYFRSFHGKANLLGGHETATCVDCHSTEAGDVHSMLSSDDPTAMTHDGNLVLTCREAGCHPNAAPEISAASVHLQVDPTVRTPEYMLIIVFVLMICFELGLNAVLAMLELLNTIIGRDHEEHRRLQALALALQRHPEGRKLLQRQTPVQRVQHWLLVLFFSGLVVSGMPLRFASYPLSQWVAQTLGGIHVLRVIHRVNAVALFVVFFFHAGYLLWAAWKDFRRRQVENPARGVLMTAVDTVWQSPIMMTHTDIIQFGQYFLYLGGLRKHPPLRPKFHYSEKMEYWAVFWGMAVIGLSGVMLWAVNYTPDLVGGRALDFAYIVHSYEAFLAMMYIVIAHLFAVMFMPAVFPLSRGSLTGDMPAEEIAEAHNGHLLEVARQVGMEIPEALPRRSFLASLGRRIYSVVMFPIVGVVAFVSLRYLVEETLGERASVDVEVLPIRLTSDSLTGEVVEPSPGAQAGLAAGVGGARTDRYQRGPLAHFHVIPNWYTPDPGNSCSGGGCHDALPHGERKETRAYLNMHTTFVDCGVCHLETPPAAASLRWVSLTEGRPEHETPAVLALATLLQEPVGEGDEAMHALDEQVQDLLERAIDESGGDATLEGWLYALRSSRLGGPVHAAVLGDIRDDIEEHGHGEYGAKIGVPGGMWSLDAAGREAAARLRAEPDLPEDQAKPLLDTVHAGLARPKVECLRCHADHPEAIDFEALGYSPSPVQALRSKSVVRMSTAVERDESFFLPHLLEEPTPPTDEGDDGTEEPPTP